MSRHFKVMVDSWGHNPELKAGTIITLPLGPDEEFPYDMDHALATNTVLEVDESGDPLETPSAEPVKPKEPPKSPFAKVREPEKAPEPPKAPSPPEPAKKP